MIYADFESTLVPEENGNQNPNDSYTNKHQKHVSCSYGYKSYLGEDAVYNYISSMIKENSYCSDVMKKHFNKKHDNVDFENISNYSTKPKYFDNSNKFVVCKMKDETAGVAIEEFVGLKPKIYLYLVDDNSEHKKAKGVNKNVVATISHNEYKDVLLNKKCLRHSMNRIQSKDHKIETYEVNKISLYCFDDKIYIQNNGCDGSALGY